MATTAQLVHADQFGEDFPSNSIPGGNGDIWDTTKSRAWTSGFYPGILWKLYDYTRRDDLKFIAGNATEGLRSQQHNTVTHDVGFIIFCSFGMGYLITQDPDYHSVILTAAESLSTRFNPVVGCLRSWNGEHFQVIIDNMMNLEILWWAALHGGDLKYFEIATSHSDHMIRDCIKPDRSSYHLIDYDPDTGAVLLKTNTPQGYPGGVWSRGEAWALYGFVRSFMYSKFQRYLDTAVLIGNYMISQLPADFIPLWDFMAPPSLPMRDSSAGSIAAAAFLDLSELVSSPADAKKFKDVATNILTSLATSRYLADPTKSNAMLLHGCIAYETPATYDVSLIYGDYYFVEALLHFSKLSGN